MTGGWAVRESRDRADADRHRQLLAAARTAFEQLGYGATTVAEITARAGVSRATFYVYFRSKEQVFAMLAEQVRDSFRAAQNLSGVDPDDVSLVLRHTIATTLEVVVENLALMSVLNHQALCDEQISTYWRQIQHEATQRTADYVAEQASRGRVQPVATPDALALMGGGLNDRYAPLVAAGQVGEDDAVEQMHRIWMACLRC